MTPAEAKTLHAAMKESAVYGKRSFNMDRIWDESGDDLAIRLVAEAQNNTVHTVRPKEAAELTAFAKAVLEREIRSEEIFIDCKVAPERPLSRHRQ